jgi:DNA-binding NtrC family response regulator
MKKDILALMVFAEPDRSKGLKEELQLQSVRTCQVRTCTEAKEFITQEAKPDIIFSDTAVPDGTWADVLRMARKEHPQAEVVVVSRFPDTKLYLDVMERGGFDFMVPPFSRTEVAHVVESATVDTAKRWGAPFRAAARA